jgi:AraC-like DNA-binding protein
VAREGRRAFGLRPRFLALSGAVLWGHDPLAPMASSRRRRNYAMQQSINLGAPYPFHAAPGIATWVLALEDRRIIHGAMLGPEVLDGDSGAAPGDVVDHLASHGLRRSDAARWVGQLPQWPVSRTLEMADFLHRRFYERSGWNAQLMGENRLRAMQMEQLNRAIEDQKRDGRNTLYAFEKERILLANIRAGDRRSARKLLNEMLAAIYMSSPQLVVLRARAVELMSCLTRAAIEDNPLLEPLIERNHTWTERLIRARSFEDLSQVLMESLDDFIDGIYLHGVNRSNTKVRKAVDFISRHHMERLPLSAVARHVGISCSRLSHLVKGLTGRTVLQLIHQVRIRNAQRLLDRSSLSCAEIAYSVGFSDQSYFIKQFRRSTGTTPFRYRCGRSGPRGAAE